jgi:hypothetical protein
VPRYLPAKTPRLDHEQITRQVIEHPPGGIADQQPFPNPPRRASAPITTTALSVSAAAEQHALGIERTRKLPRLLERGQRLGRRILDGPTKMRRMERMTGMASSGRGDVRLRACSASRA